MQPTFVDLGRMAYAPAYQAQLEHFQAVLDSRQSGKPEVGRILLVEHDPPVITVSRRQGAASHLLASPDHLARLGVEVSETDRGGDITYHGPGQLVAYPILDLNALGLNLHAYMRLLEQVAMDTCAAFGVVTERDACATGVWVPRDRAVGEPAGTAACAGVGSAKVCALGVRVRRWVSMHGLALNVTTNLDHFKLIVPCGLVGRPVTSLCNELGERCPTMQDVKRELSHALIARCHEQLASGRNAAMR